MRGSRWLTCLALGAFCMSLGACQAVPLELDEDFARREAICADVDCALPQCPDGGDDCLACLCCSCPEGEAFCDPLDGDQRWVCNGGCWVGEPCPVDAACDPFAGECVGGEIDCDRVDPFELVWVCGQNEEICEACGCYTCSDPGWEVYCDYRPNSDPALLVCTNDGCFDQEPCNAGAICENGWETGIASCSDEVDCDNVGCTSPKICGEPSSSCGSCGCCEVYGSGVGDFCYVDPYDGVTPARWLVDEEGGCYDVIPCESQKSCAYDEYNRPICVSP